MKRKTDWFLWILIAVAVVTIPLGCIGNYYVQKARFPDAPPWTWWAK
jgi:hypothetical protein